MVEAELITDNLETVMKLTERLIKLVIDVILDKYLDELECLERYSQKEIISKLKTVQKKVFIRLDYAEAIKILKASYEIE